MNATMTSPRARVEWDRMPSSASVGRAWRSCNAKSARETRTATANTPAITEMFSRKARATPSSAEWDMVSPK